MTPSSCTANSTSSPSLTCSACLIGSGRVSCAFWRSLARALVRGCNLLSRHQSRSRMPPGSATGKVQISQPILARDRDAMQVYELSGQPRTAFRHKIVWRGGAATLLTCLEIRSSLNHISSYDFILRRLLRAMSTADVAGPVAEVLAEGVGEVRCRRKAAPCSDVGHSLGLIAVRGTDQHRVGEVQTAG